MNAATTIAQQARIMGFKANLAIRGRWMTTDGKERVQVMVQDEPLLADPVELGRAKLPVYCTLHALAGSLKLPRVKTFTEDGGRVFTVIEHKPTVADAVSLKWFCEAQRV
jgi:hypothetical protein